MYYICMNDINIMLARLRAYLYIMLARKNPPRFMIAVSTARGSSCLVARLGATQNFRKYTSGKRRHPKTRGRAVSGECAGRDKATRRTARIAP